MIALYSIDIGQLFRSSKGNSYLDGIDFFDIIVTYVIFEVRTHVEPDDEQEVEDQDTMMMTKTAGETKLERSLYRARCQS